MISLSSVAALLEVPHPANEPRPTALVSHDVKPIEKERRVWGWTGYLSLWGVVAFCMANFQLGSSMLALGLTWWQTILVTLVGHIFGSFFMMITATPGLDYHISFPVSTRIAWGYFGSIFVVLNRIVTCCIFAGVQGWLGGLITYVCLRAIWPSIDHIHNTLPASTGTNLPQFIGFIVYYILQLMLCYVPGEKVRYLLMVGGCLGFVIQLVLVCWACATMGDLGFGDVLSSQTTLHGSKLAWTVVFGMSLTTSSITSGTLSVCDFTRYSSSFHGGFWPHLAGALPAWLANVFGVLTIAATQNRYGAALWNMPTLLIAIQEASPTSRTRVAVFFAAFGMGILQLGVNVCGNTFSGGTDMASLLPRWINNRRGQFLTAAVGVCINPWYLMSSASVFLSAMSAYTVILQPFLGIVVAQYLFVQKRRIQVPDLYVLGPRGIYWYTFGVNWRAVVAWAIGGVPHIPGFAANVNSSIKVSTGASRLYYMDSYTGFVIPFVVFIFLHWVAPVKRQQAFIASVTVKEAKARNEEYIEQMYVIHGAHVEEADPRPKTASVGEKDAEAQVAAV